VKVHFNSGTSADVEVLPCPFCGGIPSIAHIGNCRSKSHKIEIKCKSCRVKRIDAAITHGELWLLNVAVENWNQRPPQEHRE